MFPKRDNLMVRCSARDVGKLDDKNPAKRMRNQAWLYDNVGVLGDDREGQLWMRKSGAADVVAHRRSDKQCCRIE